MSVELKLSEEEARELYAGIKRARDVLKQGIWDGNIGKAGDAFGWLDARLTVLSDATPESIKNPDIQLRGGGGQDKP